MTLQFDMTSPAAMAFAAFLRANGYSCILPIDHQRYACLCPFAFTTAIVTGRWFDYGGLDDRWCYSSPEDALGALLDWAVEDFQDEPNGWHRHHRTGRRRPHGDASKEYINP